MDPSDESPAVDLTPAVEHGHVPVGDDVPDTAPVLPPTERDDSEPLPDGVGGGAEPGAGAPGMPAGDA